MKESHAYRIIVAVLLLVVIALALLLFHSRRPNQKHEGSDKRNPATGADVKAVNTDVQTVSTDIRTVNTDAQTSNSQLFSESSLAALGLFKTFHKAYAERQDKNFKLRIVTDEISTELSEKGWQKTMAEFKEGFEATGVKGNVYFRLFPTQYDAVSFESVRKLLSSPKKSSQTFFCIDVSSNTPFGSTSAIHTNIYNPDVLEKEDNLKTTLPLTWNHYGRISFGVVEDEVRVIQVNIITAANSDSASPDPNQPKP